MSNEIEAQTYSFCMNIEINLAKNGPATCPETYCSQDAAVARAL